jgi:hypothetical protein
MRKAPARPSPDTRAAEPAHLPGRPFAVIEPYGVYFLRDLIAAVRAKRTAIRAAIAAGELHASVIAGRYVFLGEAILDWIRNAPGPRPKRKPAAVNGQALGGQEGGAAHA